MKTPFLSVACAWSVLLKSAEYTQCLIALGEIFVYNLSNKCNNDTGALFTENFIYRFKYIFVLYFIFFICLGLFGLLFNLHSGLIAGLVVASFLFIILSVWGEKLVLIFAKARYVTDDEVLINQVKNFCCHCEIPEVKVYWSHLFSNNIYYFNSYLGQETLVIGKNAYTKLSRNELNSLIYASLLKLRTSEAMHRTMASLIFLILFSPVYLIRLMISNEEYLKLINIFLYPPHYVKSKLYETKKSILEFDQQVAKLEGLKKDYISALFKIAQMSSCHEKSIGADLLSDLCHIKNTSEDVLNSLLNDSVTVEERVKGLR